MTRALTSLALAALITSTGTSAFAYTGQMSMNQASALANFVSTEVSTRGIANDGLGNLSKVQLRQVQQILSSGDSSAEIHAAIQHLLRG